MRLKIQNVITFTILPLEELYIKIKELIDRREYSHIVLLDLRVFVKMCFSKRLRKIFNESSTLVIPIGKFFTWGLGVIGLGKGKFHETNSFSKRGGKGSGYLEIERRRELLKEHLIREDRLHLSVILMKNLIRSKSRFFLVGGKPKHGIYINKYIKQSFPDTTILGIHSEEQLRKEGDAILEKIKKIGPTILLVDLGVYKHDVWINRNKDFFKSSVCIGISNEISFLAGQESDVGFFRRRIIMYPFLLIYYLLYILMYKTVLRGEVECLEE